MMDTRLADTDHWFVDRDESGLLGTDVVRASFASELLTENAALRAALRQMAGYAGRFVDGEKARLESGTNAVCRRIEVEIIAASELIEPQ